MNKADLETKSLVYITLSAYVLNLLFSLLGYLCDHFSTSQTLFFQVGNAFAILASVMAGRYTGLRGQHVAASAYILLGITHGISLAALSRTAINVDRGMTMAMPMIPALVCIFWCSLYPLWLRAAGIIPIVLFALVYINVQMGGDYFGWRLEAGYGTLQAIELLWGIYILKDWRENSK
ncbi:MAG TPA: hypothetical protein VK174_11585 [Chitinophagales bacterium]|nr:hypothetical protein [Chitinophagales bacterium]